MRIILNLLQKTGSSFEDTSKVLLDMRMYLVDILLNLTTINQFGYFVWSSLTEQIFTFFAENLTKAKDWCLKMADAKNKIEFDGAERPLNELSSLVVLTVNVMSDDNDEEGGNRRLLADEFLKQADSFFQNTLLELFEAFIALRRTKTVSDRVSLSITEGLSSIFCALCSSPSLRYLWADQVQSFLRLFFSDKDLVKKC